MYGDWMDGIPLLFEGYYDNNIAEMQIAADYYERQGDLETANRWRERISEERRKQEEYNSLSMFGKIKRYFNK